ncbi:hypothetical protein HYT00_01365 [Candidatus Giovannonibacteria bacterium]|nr:hypothetical protein [Candidatus Giovannonibacteria bacterium]
MAVGSLTLLFPDLPEISDSDLIASNIVLPPKEENAYFSLVKISEQIYEPAGDANKKYMEFLEGKAWDKAAADLILSKNENVLTEVRKSAALSYYQCPTTAENISFTTELCPLNYLRVSARLTSLSALSRAYKDDFQGAIEDALAPIHIGQLLMQEPRITLIDYLVGDAMKRIGLKTLQIILTKQDVPSKMLIPQISEMEKYNQNEGGLKNAFKLEYLAGKNGLAFVNKIDSNFYIQPNRFFTEMAEDTRQNIALADVPCHRLNQAIKEHQKSFEEKLPKIVVWKLPLTRNAVFEVLKSVVMADLSTTQTKRCEADLLVEQTRFQMALEAYKYDNNKHPVSQSELVPKYLTKPILNPLTNNEFSFNQDTGEIMLFNQ